MTNSDPGARSRAATEEPEKHKLLKKGMLAVIENCQNTKGISSCCWASAHADPWTLRLATCWRLLAIWCTLTRLQKLFKNSLGRGQRVQGLHLTSKSPRSHYDQASKGSTTNVLMMLDTTAHLETFWGSPCLGRSKLLRSKVKAPNLL